jgi:uncharacterized membrane protein YoaK (UPF0700 family)
VAVPPGPSERTKIATLIGMAGIGGYVDAVSYLGLGHVFTAAMTGNTVLLALAVGEQDWSAAGRALVALLGFVGGVAVGQVLVGRFTARIQWPRAVSIGLLMELVLLLMLAAGWYFSGTQTGWWGLHPLIAVSALAMGVQSATARTLGVAAVTTTYVTGTLTALSCEVVDWLRSPRAARKAAAAQPKEPLRPTKIYGPRLPAVAWGVYFVAALLGGLAVIWTPAVAVLPAGLAVVLLALADFRMRSPTPQPPPPRTGEGERPPAPPLRAGEGAGG